MKKITVWLVLIGLLLSTAGRSFEGSAGGASDSVHAKTYADVMAFLAADQTDTLVWTPDFNCVQFTNTLIEHARAHGFLVHESVADWTTPDADGFLSHEFIAFELAGGQIVLIEPQSDLEYSLLEIRQAHLCSGEKCWPETAQSIYYYMGDVPNSYPVFLFPAE